MIAGLSNIPNTSSDLVKAEDSRQELDRDNFLKLFVAQLQHQDPLNPTDSQEFTAQLAQFSSLEQLFNLNDTLESIKSSQDNNSRLQALGFIGKEIVAEGQTLSLEEGQRSVGEFVLDGSAACYIRILAPDGHALREMSQGTLEAGEHTFEWDGYDEAGNLQPPGSYVYEITAVDAQGESVPVATRIRGSVTRVRLGAESPILYVGEVPVAMSEVLDIKLPEDTLGAAAGADSDNISP